MIGVGIDPHCQFMVKRVQCGTGLSGSGRRLRSDNGLHCGPVVPAEQAQTLAVARRATTPPFFAA